MQISAASLTDSNSVATTVNNAAKDSKADAKLRAACKGFEAIFINMMLTEMRKTVPPDPIMGDSNEHDIMQSMLDSELSKNMSQAGGIGLADILYRQLTPQIGKVPANNKGQTSEECALGCSRKQSGKKVDDGTGLNGIVFVLGIGNRLLKNGRDAFSALGLFYTLLCKLANRF